MMHICTETITVQISKLVKGAHDGEHAKTCLITDEMLQSIEEVVGAMMQDESLVITASHEHNSGDDVE